MCIRNSLQQWLDLVGMNRSTVFSYRALHCAAHEQHTDRKTSANHVIEKHAATKAS
jgi:hypothetical protein